MAIWEHDDFHQLILGDPIFRFWDPDYALGSWNLARARAPSFGLSHLESLIPFVAENVTQETSLQQASKTLNVVFSLLYWQLLLLPTNHSPRISLVFCVCFCVTSQSTVKFQSPKGSLIISSLCRQASKPQSLESQPSEAGSRDKEYSWSLIPCKCLASIL